MIACSDVVIIANAAKFHPMHMTAAIDAGKHVFVEKPHAIDPAGIKAVRAACEKAKQKNLCVVSGLHSRYQPGYIETMRRIHEGALGKVISIEENCLRPPYQVYNRRPGMKEVDWQGSNQYHFHWLSGDDVTQSLVHNLDRASWVLNDAAPLRCHGMGGRSTLHGEPFGSTFDHHSVVYEFPERCAFTPSAGPSPTVTTSTRAAWPEPKEPVRSWTSVSRVKILGTTKRRIWTATRPSTTNSSKRSAPARPSTTAIT